MISELTPDQRKLAEYMSDLSEDAYCAGWMEGLEIALWEVVEGTRTDYGRLTFTDLQRTDLKSLSETSGGWIVFDDRNEETFP